MKQEFEPTLAKLASEEWHSKNLEYNKKGNNMDTAELKFRERNKKIQFENIKYFEENTPELFENMKDAWKEYFEQEATNKCLDESYHQLPPFQTINVNEPPVNISFDMSIISDLQQQIDNFKEEYYEKIETLTDEFITLKKRLKELEIIRSQDLKRSNAMVSDVIRIKARIRELDNTKHSL